jgi:DNA-binding MarR family transcriptional regulator
VQGPKVVKPFSIWGALIAQMMSVITDTTTYSPALAESDTLSQWELRILSSIRKEAKSEKKIAKDIALNALTTSQLITGLMSKGYIERTMSKARIRRYSYRERFSITQEGLSMLDEFIRRNSPWNHLKQELPLKMIIGAVRIVYGLAKFMLKS